MAAGVAVLAAVGAVAGQGVILRQECDGGTLSPVAVFTAEGGLQPAVGLFYPEARLAHLLRQILGAEKFPVPQLRVLEYRAADLLKPRLMGVLRRKQLCFDLFHGSLHLRYKNKNAPVLPKKRKGEQFAVPPCFTAAFQPPPQLRRRPNGRLTEERCNGRTRRQLIPGDSPPMLRGHLRPQPLVLSHHPDSLKSGEKRGTYPVTAFETISN